MSNTDLWTTRREATLNWLALGLLLAAWNAADSDSVRPEALRGYPYVSVRTANRATGIERPNNRANVTEF
jgi:hypothetical protein